MVLGMSTDIALVGFGAAMKRLQSLHPDLELKIVVTSPNKLDGLLQSGKLDLAICDPNLTTGNPSFTWQVPLQWAASKELHIDQSRVIPLVLFERPCSWQEKMLSSLRAPWWKWRVTFESASLDAVLAAVQSGLGMAALPTESIRNEKLRRIRLAALPPPPKIQFGLFRNAPLPSEARNLLEVRVDSMLRNISEALFA